MSLHLLHPYTAPPVIRPTVASVHRTASLRPTVYFHRNRIHLFHRATADPFPLPIVRCTPRRFVSPFPAFPSPPQLPGVFAIRRRIFQGMAAPVRRSSVFLWFQLAICTSTCCSQRNRHPTHRRLPHPVSSTFHSYATVPTQRCLILVSQRHCSSGHYQCNRSYPHPNPTPLFIWSLPTQAFLSCILPPFQRTTLPIHRSDRS